MAYGSNQLISQPVPKQTTGKVSIQQFPATLGEKQKAVTAGSGPMAGPQSSTTFYSPTPMKTTERVSSVDQKEIEMYKKKQEMLERKSRAIGAGESLAEMALATGFMVGVGSGNIPLALVSGAGFLAEQVFKPEISKLLM